MRFFVRVLRTRSERELKPGMMDIVVNDTNIFLDLMSVGLLDASFRLPVKFHTVDSVIYEIIGKEQKAKVAALIRSGDLYVKEFDESEFREIIELYENRNNNVSVADCSVWYYAKKNDYRLITGDGKLRSSATADGVIVSGVLYITDMLVDHGIVDKEDMAVKLKELYKVNKRLPQRLIEERISKYESL